MLNRPGPKIDRFLESRGFPPGQVRMVAGAVLLLAAVLLAAGVLVLPFATWPLWLGVGAALSAWNFYSLARFVLLLFPAAAAGSSGQRPANISFEAASRRLLIGQLLRSNLRLFITGFFVYVSLVVFQANPFALVAGLSAVVAVSPPLLLRQGKNARKG